MKIKRVSSGVAAAAFASVIFVGSAVVSTVFGNRKGLDKLNQELSSYRAMSEGWFKLFMEEAETNKSQRVVLLVVRTLIEAGDSDQLLLAKSLLGQKDLSAQLKFIDSYELYKLT